MKLSSENVSLVFLACLLTAGEPTENHVLGQGAILKAGFHPGRLEENRQSVSEMLECLPDSFKEKAGGGMSFLNMVVDKDGNQWADLHQTVDQLVALGTALGLVKFTMPKELWDALPGGMPYLTVVSNERLIPA